MRRRFVAYGVGFIAVPLAVFLAVAEDVAEHAVFSWDKGLLHFAALHRSGALTALFEFATRLGTTAVMSALTGSLLLYLLARRRWRDALFAGVAVGGAALLNAAVKEMFRRPRPDLFRPLAHASGFAFPSGHTMSSAALAAVVVALTWPTRWRWPALAASALFTLVVGFSRVYLGVHYPSDVVGGWALSLAFVSATYLAAYRRGRAVGMGPAPLSSDTD